MSGPKTSTAQLRAREQEKARQEALRKADEMKRKEKERLRRLAEERRRKEKERERRRQEQLRIEAQKRKDVLIQDIKKIQEQLKISSSQHSNALVSSLKVNTAAGEKELRKQLADLQSRAEYIEQINKIADEIDFSYVSQKLVDEFSALKLSLEGSPSLDELKKFRTVTLPDFVQRANKSSEINKKIESDYDSLFSDYDALCRCCGIQPKEIPVSKAGLAELGRLNNHLKNVLAKREEQELIKKIIDEVMSELGYSVLAVKSVEDNSGDKCQKMLVQYSEDEAVDVTITSDGQVTMEIGLMDNCSRAPDDNETSSLCNSMEKFCGDYKEIAQRLYEKGVIFTEGNYLPPEPAYAEIINVSDYGLEIENVEVADGYIEETEENLQQNSTYQQAGATLYMNRDNNG